MKAALVLVVLYVGMFFVAIQGGSPGSVQAAAQNSLGEQANAKTAAVDLAPHPGRPGYPSDESPTSAR